MNNNANSHRNAMSQHSKTEVIDKLCVEQLSLLFTEYSKNKIHTNFAHGDKWPNEDGYFEYINNNGVKDYHKRIAVQIKGTEKIRFEDIENDKPISYSMNINFLGYSNSEVTSDPCFLFLIIKNEDKYKFFYKYMTKKLLDNINYNQQTKTIHFNKYEEIEKGYIGIEKFCKKIEDIIDHHEFIQSLNSYVNEKTINEKIQYCDKHITSYISEYNEGKIDRDELCYEILHYVTDLSVAVLNKNYIEKENKNKCNIDNIKLSTTFEYALLNENTRFLAIFLKCLKYIENNYYNDDSSERLMLKYYDFLWEIKKFLNENYNIKILKNLKQFPQNCDKNNDDYYNAVARAINENNEVEEVKSSRLVIVKNEVFYFEEERYFEITLQLEDIYSSKYDRFVVYSKKKINTKYPIMITYVNIPMILFGSRVNIKFIKNWEVSIHPQALNGIAKVTKQDLQMKSSDNEYKTLMNFFYATGMNLLELIDLSDEIFNTILNEIYHNLKIKKFVKIIKYLKRNCSKEKLKSDSKEVGIITVRYLILDLDRKHIKYALDDSQKKLNSRYFNLSSKCYAFDARPFLMHFPGTKSANTQKINKLKDIAGDQEYNKNELYINVKKEVEKTGEVYISNKNLNYIDDLNSKILEFNHNLDNYARYNGYSIKTEDNYIYIDQIYQTTKDILFKLYELSNVENKGQKAHNENFVSEYKKRNKGKFDDYIKENILRNIFVNSRIMLIYGAAGTGKTTLMNMISDLMDDKKKLFLTKTHVAKENLRRRIENPGRLSDFVSIDSFTKKVELSNYEVIFIDECSTIDNRTMKIFLDKINKGTFIVMAGDIFQIESIEFGNWFFYAKDIIEKSDANEELMITWRTSESKLKNLWSAVRNSNQKITEELIKNNFSFNICNKIFDRYNEDEIVLCLNYDGKFGVNNINYYFQAQNKKSEFYKWKDWGYKRGDPILFNFSERFPILYNNLKGEIENIECHDNKITFTIIVDTILREDQCLAYGIEWIDILDDGKKTLIKFDVYREQEESKNYDECIIPFQLAYAVSIHQAQGLEYESVKIVIPGNNLEQMTKEIFYTAITRAKKNLEIYWSPETMHKILKNIYNNRKTNKSLSIIKNKMNID